MTLFRLHAGALVDSLKTAVLVENVTDVREAVEKHLNEIDLSSYGQPMYIEYFGYDERIQKDMYLVSLKYHGIIGWVEI
ncbi:hypothetical protein NSQ62_07910 [Solibacillus sp. FSL H8-0523]|uniref:hypothetical protein n=1 Tax=Solibacillus sp. FSL H8-0523 TaxID=2954511 RepID=UPI0031015447